MAARPGRVGAAVAVGLACLAAPLAGQQDNARTAGQEKPAGGRPGASTNEEGQPAALPRLPEGVTLELIRRGDDIFHEAGRCFVCHGADATGRPNAGSALTQGLYFVPEDWRAIATLVTQGLPEPVTRSAIAMPPRGGKSNLSDDQIQAVAAYVWAISQVRGEPWPGGHESHESMVPLAATTGTAAGGPPSRAGGATPP
jgi:mono/diheme cytochrome c family protein